LKAPFASFQYELTEGDRVALLRFILRNDNDLRRTRRRGLLGLFLSVAWLGPGVAIGTWFAIVQKLWHWPLWIMADAALVLVCIFVVQRWSLRGLASRAVARERRWEAQGLLVRDHSVQLLATDDGLRVSTGDHTANHRWTAMKRLDVASDGIFITFGSSANVQLPARLFASAQEMNRFADSARRLAGQRV
jgi:MFS family permease